MTPKKHQKHHQHVHKPTIGIVEHVSIGTRAVNVPAKIDTGADSSAIWATNIRVTKEGILTFSLFGEGSPYYNGKVFKRKHFSVAQVRSSNGESQVRYRTHFTLKMAGKNVRVNFNLSDRSRNEYKILIGRRTISGKFLVDVSERANVSRSGKKTRVLQQKLLADPYKFHKKYVKSGK